MSRTPVREALLMLESEKLVECDPRLGFLVRKLTPKEVEEYFAIRILFEEFAAPLIIERITLPEVESLKQNIAEAQGYVEANDLHNIIRCETEFHAILYKATKSDVFFQTISGLMDKFQWLRAIALSAPDGSSLSLEDHKKILVAIEEKDVNALKGLLNEHMEHARKKYELVKAVIL